jgi:chromate transporter
MKKDAKFYVKLFSSTFLISAFTFGGGYVMIPMVKKRFVEEYKWLEEEEMINLVSIAQASPGAIAVNTAIILGYRLSGFIGVFITLIGTVLPPFIIISVLSSVYSMVNHNLIIQFILRGMQAGVAVVILDVVISMLKPMLKDKNFISFMILIIAFIGTSILKWNVGVILIVSGILGVIFYDKKSYLLRRK